MARSIPTVLGPAVADGEGRPPVLSIVVPTRNEADNVEELARRLDQAMPDQPIEIIFVDDSTDRTPEAVAALQGRHRPTIVLLHRPREQRGDGLGGAVVRGLRLARAPWVCVMDADLQHPPAMVPELLRVATRDQADLVVASRYCARGEAGEFGRLRAAVSQSSTVAARLLFPNRLRNVSDPMSGFFLVRRNAVELDALRPCGFKILLEIIGRTPGLRIKEVPFRFGTRHAGESKASLREGLRYFQLLLTLRLGDGPLRLARFGLVGLSGVVVNALILGFTTEVLGVFYLLSAVIATQGSSFWNFGLTETWVFGSGQRRGRLRRLAAFLFMNNAALGLRGPMLFTLTSVFGIHYLISNLISLVALLLLRYGAADRVIWAQSQRAAAADIPDGVALPMPLSGD